MSTKAEMETLVTTNLASASAITATEHRDVLKDDVASFLSAIYADVAQEDSAATLTITTNNVKFNYDLYFCKTGRKVLVYGSITCLGNFERGQVVLDISLAEYQTALNTYVTSNTSLGVGISIAHIGNQILVGNAVAQGEIFRINYEYTVTN